MHMRTSDVGKPVQLISIAFLISFVSMYTYVEGPIGTGTIGTGTEIWGALPQVD